MAQMLTLAALAADPDRFHLIDVRDAEDYAAAHVAGAVHIPLAELEDRAEEIPAGRTAVAICGKGGRAIRRRGGHPEQARPAGRRLARKRHDRLACTKHLYTKKPEWRRPPDDPETPTFGDDRRARAARSACDGAGRRPLRLCRNT